MNAHDAKALLKRAYGGTKRGTPSVKPATVTEIPEQENHSDQTRMKCMSTDDTTCPLGGNKIGRGARLELPTRRTFTYGKSRVRHVIEDEELWEMQLASMGSRCNYLPSRHRR